MARPIYDNVRNRDALHEPFSRSDTTIIASGTEAWRVWAMTLSPAYVDLAVMRRHDFNGCTAMPLDRGQAFAELKAARSIGSTHSQDRVAEGMGLGSNVLLWMPLGLQGISNHRDM